MIAYDEACALVDKVSINVRLPQEVIDVLQGYHRVIVEEPCSKLDLPPFRKSAMDGYAVMADDLQESYQRIETVPAGQFPRLELRPGTTIQVMTGSPVPLNTGRVIPVELTQVKDNKMVVVSDSYARHICEQGEDIKKGEKIFPASMKLGPLEISNLISCGVTEVSVYQKPKVAILSTGDEVVDAFEQLQPGKIMNSNGPLLRLLCEQHGWSVVMVDVVNDNLDQTQSKLIEALAKADIVISSGGVSMGKFDYVVEAIRTLGFNLHFDRVAMKPGKPMTFASKNQQFIFALPGNPVSVYLSFHLFVKRLVANLMNMNFQKRDEGCLLVSSVTRRNAERLEFMLGKKVDADKLEPVTNNGSADLLALQRADGFFLIPQGIKEIEKNTRVRFMSWEKL